MSTWHCAGTGDTVVNKTDRDWNQSLRSLVGKTDIYQMSRQVNIKSQLCHMLQRKSVTKASNGQGSIYSERCRRTLKTTISPASAHTVFLFALCIAGCRRIDSKVGGITGGSPILPGSLTSEPTMKPATLCCRSIYTVLPTLLPLHILKFRLHFLRNCLIVLASVYHFLPYYPISVLQLVFKGPLSNGRTLP